MKKTPKEILLMGLKSKNERKYKVLAEENTIG
jgi:hypothetical protein